MNKDTKDRIKEALISILIGAVVAFLTTFLEGALEILQNTENNAVGAITSTLAYLSRRHII